MEGERNSSANALAAAGLRGKRPQLSREQVGPPISVTGRRIQPFYLSARPFRCSVCAVQSAGVRVVRATGGTGGPRRAELLTRDALRHRCVTQTGPYARGRTLPMTTARRTCLLVGVATLCLVLSGGSAFASSAEVPATADIFAAGQTTPPGFLGGGGTLPPSVSAGAGKTLIISATGAIDCCGGTPTTPPDGNPGGSTNISGWEGISGFVDGSSSVPLVGVFTNGAPPTSPPPPSLDFSADALTQDFATVAPVLNQVFFIGDGATSSGASQGYVVPKAGKRLYLGFADAWGFNGSPGLYSDNTGQEKATVTTGITNPVVTNAALPLAVLANSYKAYLAAAGGATPYTWTITSGQLPPGLTLSASTGLISGKPTTAGSYPIVAQVADAGDRTASRPLTIEVVAEPAVTKVSPAVGTVEGGQRLVVEGSAFRPGYAIRLSPSWLPSFRHTCHPSNCQPHLCRRAS